VIANDPRQLAALDELERRGRANGLELNRLRAEEIASFEPEATGIAALHVPAAGVVDFPSVARHLADRLREVGVHFRFSHRLRAVEESQSGLRLATDGESFHSRYLINCAGLHSDRVARLCGVEPSVRIVPFRGEYYTLTGHLEVNALIYPVPDPRFPFLGVHFTRRIDGIVEVGPNALLALAREQYRGSPPNWRDFVEMVRFRGFRRLARANLFTGARELVSSKSKRLYARLASKLVPGVRAENLEPGGVGVRAQAVDLTGHLVDDFAIEATERTVHVLNAPSPGATACLAIGSYVAALTDRLFEGRPGQSV
jgi:L-2-hydroxyglutarate oxidase